MPTVAAGTAGTAVPPRHGTLQPGEGKERESDYSPDIQALTGIYRHVKSSKTLLNLLFLAEKDVFFAKGIFNRVPIQREIIE